ncbi:transposase [Deinococcus radiodurans]|uniref:transposase n=1 Tax=Deinococcus radiodurans TaxID=1299 RepID=UPI0002E854EB|nr:transposase [Deinococcus radiodurans]
MPGWQPTQYSRAQLEERRLAALEWIERGTHRNREIAQHFGVSVHTVYTWKARLKRNGGLQATVARGASARLSATQHEQLRTLPQEGALHHGFPDDTWTTLRVTNLIGRHFDVWYHHDHVRKILRRLGFTPQMPDGRAAERNELRIASWKEQVAPELEKKGR